MNIEDINYISLKLDEPSKEKLVNLVKIVFGNKYKRIYCDHITLAYGKDQVSKFNMSLCGKTAELHVNTLVYDDHCAAIVVDMQEVEGLGINNLHPHITLATDGTSPVYSNQLLSNYNDQNIQGYAISTSQYMIDHNDIIAINNLCNKDTLANEQDKLKLDAIVIKVPYIKK